MMKKTKERESRPGRIPPRVFSELTSGPSEEFSQSVAGAFLPIRGTGVVENVREDGVVARDSSWNGVKRHRERTVEPRRGELHVDRADAGSGENVCERLRRFDDIFLETDFKITDYVEHEHRFKSLTIVPKEELVAYGLAKEKAPSAETKQKQTRERDGVSRDVER